MSGPLDAVLAISLASVSGRTRSQELAELVEALDAAYRCALRAGEVPLAGNLLDRRDRYRRAAEEEAP